MSCEKISSKKSANLKWEAKNGINLSDEIDLVIEFYQSHKCKYEYMEILKYECIKAKAKFTFKK